MSTKNSSKKLLDRPRIIDQNIVALVHILWKKKNLWYAFPHDNFYDLYSK